MIEKQITELNRQIIMMEREGEREIIIEEKKNILELYQKQLKNYLEEKLNTEEISNLRK